MRHNQLTVAPLVIMHVDIILVALHQYTPVTTHPRQLPRLISRFYTTYPRASTTLVLVRALVLRVFLALVLLLALFVLLFLSLVVLLVLILILLLVLVLVRGLVT